MSRRSKTLCKNVCKLVTSGNITNLKILAKRPLVHKMVIHFNMLGVCMKDRIKGNGKSRDIVTPERRSK